MIFQDMPGHLIRRLHQFSTHVFQVQSRNAGFDITPVQFAAMSAIRSQPGIDQARVASRIAYDRATIGGVLERLEQKGLLTRKVSSRDRRAREVTLTPKGHEVFDAILPVVQDMQTRLLPGLTEQERDVFLSLARKAAIEIDEADPLGRET